MSTYGEEKGMTRDVHTMIDDCFQSLNYAKMFMLSVLECPTILVHLLSQLLLGIFFCPHHQNVCGKMLYCFTLALWPRTPRGH